MNKIDLLALTLVEPTQRKPTKDPPAVEHLENWPYVYKTIQIEALMDLAVS